MVSQGTEQEVAMEGCKELVHVLLCMISPLHYSLVNISHIPS